MDTVRNRPKVIAIVLREAVKVLNNPRSEFKAIVSAVEAIESAAEELEAMAAAPEPES